jgi:polyhydroxybutyrate depolymerase
MLHTHGWTDGTVPLEGRVLNGVPIDDSATRAQGDIFHAMSIWRKANGCDFGKADRFELDSEYWTRSWDRCAPDTALELALFPGGHMIPKTWPDLVVDWYETL